jgi:hypothetical protein
MTCGWCGRWPRPRRFLRHVQGDRLYPLWRLLMVTGGELCGLQWCDLEPDLATLKVCRQRVVEDPTSQVREKPPKSYHSTRTLSPRSGDYCQPD